MQSLLCAAIYSLIFLTFVPIFLVSLSALLFAPFFLLILCLFVVSAPWLFSFRPPSSFFPFDLRFAVQIATRTLAAGTGAFNLSS